MNQNTNMPMSEKEMLFDVLSSEKQMTGTYNHFVTECATPAVRTEALNILRDEHCIQGDVFTELQKRGWYPTPMAEQQKINSAKQKFSGQSAQ